MDAHGFQAAIDRRFGGEELGHTRFHVAALAAIVDMRRILHEEPRRPDLRCHLAELELDRLMLADRLAERPSLLAVTHCLVERGLGHADAARGDIDAAQLETTQRMLEPA